ncbi:MAG: helix-turn-helix domain-containing protein [Deltaproteobacteria bacterium]|nr:helix-turn-helix domain-containing protein [Deltaproteobacteria bacterium]
MNAHAINLPTVQDAETARTAIEAVRSLVSERRTTTIRLRTPDADEDVEVTLPGEALHLLIRVLTHMANGHAVTVMPVQAELTTQHAADLLGVSRPYLVRLLEDGKIPFHKVGTHRRVRAVDLVEYQRKRRTESRSILDELTREAQELDMGY